MYESSLLCAIIKLDFSFCLVVTDAVCCAGADFEAEQGSALPQGRVPSPRPPRRHEEADALPANRSPGQHGQF